MLESAVGYDEVGVASWYGEKFHGQPTSSGQIYNMFKLTAAHKTLPIPSYARVTNRENGKTTIVRINDRGPFRNSRLIDLSYASAVKLGFADVGTARVRVETLLPGDVDPPGRSGKSQLLCACRTIRGTAIACVRGPYGPGDGRCRSGNDRMAVEDSSLCGAHRATLDTLGTLNA